MTITTYDGTNIMTTSGTGWEINITEPASSSSNIELSANTTAAVQKGDLIVATFYYRRKDSASGAEANFSCDFQSVASPNTPSFSLPLRGRAYPANTTPLNGNPVTATDTIWRHISIPFTSAAAYAAGGAQFNFFMGAAGLQVLDIANVSLTDYGQCSIFGNTNSIDSSSYFTEDTTASGVTYGTMSPINSVNVAGTGLPLYTTATQVQTTVPPAQTWGGPPVTWDFRLDNRLPVATNVGDTLVALFWTRATAVPSGVPYAVAGVTATGCAGGSFNLMIDPNAGWREWIIPLKVVKAESAYNTDFYINFGFQLQTVQVAGIQLVDLGQQLGGSGVPCTLTSQAFDYPGRSLTESWPGNWRAAAAANIARYRQGTLSVNVEDGSGNSLPSVNVVASMTAPLFGFGCQTSSTPVIGWDDNGLVDQNGLNLFYQLFNHVEMGCYKWGEWETGAQPAYNAKTLQTIRALGKGGTFDFRAHNLIWPADSLCPPDVASINSAAAMTARIDGHITAMVGDPAVHGYFTDWDAVNEPYDHNDEMQVENGLPRHSTGGETQPFGAPSVLQAQNDALAIAPWLAFTHATDTHAHLFINDWGIETNTNHIDTSHEDYDANLMTNLENANAHLDGVGFESHFVDSFTAPLLLTKMFNRFANGLAPGHSLIENVTEFDETESSGLAAAFPPDVDLYSDFMNDYLTEVFSQPNFDFFDLWTLGSLYNAYPIAGTNPVQNNWVLMPYGEAWMSLARNQWWTNTSAASSNSGVATLSNCFLGRYCLTATSGNITKKYYTDLPTTAGSATTLQLSGSSGTSNVWLYEAEKPANPIYSPLAVYSDPTASGGQYVMAPFGGSDNSTPPASPEMRVDTEATGTVNVWMRVNATSSSEDTFWMAVDNGTWQSVQLTDATAWHWVKVSTSLALAAGTTHSLFLSHGKCGAQLDQVLITDDLSFIPASSPVFAVGSPPPAAIAGTSYNYSISVLGSPASVLSLSGGALPPGLGLSSTGVISGVPTQAGTFTFAVSATNGTSAAVTPATQTFSITVNSTFSSWAGQFFTAQQLSNPALTGPDVSFENDGVNNVLKYLFDINPTEIMTSADLAALPVVGTTTLNGVSYLTLTYRENQLLSGLTVGVQTSTDLKNWTTVLPTINQPVGTDPLTGDPMEQVGVILTNPSCQFIRLNITTHSNTAAYGQDLLGAFDAQGNYLGLLANSDTRISIPFLRPAAFTGSIQSISGNVISIAGTPNWTTNQFVYTPGVQKNTYLALLGAGTGTTNPKEGAFYAVTANDSGSVTVFLNGDDISTVPANTQITIVPCWTLNTLFPPSAANTSFTPTATTRAFMTEAYIPDYSDPGINLAPSKIFYFLSNSTNMGWRQVGDAVTTDHGNVPLTLDGFIIVRNQNGAPTLPLAIQGVVPTGKFSVPLATLSTGPQDNPEVIIRPVSISLNNCGLTPADGSFVATTSTRKLQDEILMYDNTLAALNKPPTITYYYMNSAWRLLGDSITTDHGNDQIVPGSGFLIRKATSNGQTVFWTNTPTY